MNLEIPFLPEMAATHGEGEIYLPVYFVREKGTNVTLSGFVLFQKL